MTVGLVIVSHSARVSDGVVELAGQMAPDVRVLAAGGASDGGLGTDAERIADAIRQADDGDGVLVLVDLGSAVLSTQVALDELVAVELRGRVRISEAPLVEGAVIGAVQASTGMGLDEVDQAATGAAGMRKARG